MASANLVYREVAPTLIPPYLSLSLDQNASPRSLEQATYQETMSSAYYRCPAQRDTRVQIRLVAEQKRIASFLNPTTDGVIDTPIDLFDEIAAACTEGSRGYEIDQEATIEPQIQKKEPLHLLARLRLYEEQQNDGDQGLIRSLSKHQSMICVKGAQRCVQRPTTSYFNQIRANSAWRNILYVAISKAGTDISLAIARFY